jgi:hypothetical protein
MGYDSVPSRESNLLEKEAATDKAASIGAAPGPGNSAPSAARFVESGATVKSHLSASEPIAEAMHPEKPKQLDDPALVTTPNENAMLQKVGAGISNTYTGIEPQSIERFAKLAEQENFGQVVAQPNVFQCNCDFDAADIGGATSSASGSATGSGSGSGGLDCDCKPETCKCKRHCDCTMA